MTDAQVVELEKCVNDKIVEGIHMYPTLYESKDDPNISQVAMHTFSMSYQEGSFH